MIGNNFLGKTGRLGNQMFQYAALRGIAANRGYDYCIPFSKANDAYTDHQLFIPFEFVVRVGEISGEIVEDKEFKFNEDLFNTCPDNVSLYGYFQTEKYFSHIESFIRRDFTFRKEILTPCKTAIKSLTSPIGLHVRRTDYITNPNHHLLDLDYYESALSQFDRNREVLVFSDEPEWCSEQSLFSDDRFYVSESGSPYVDMCLMSLCSDHIIANSSFSWWAAWLGTNNRVIAPENWFGTSDNSHLDTSDIIPERWEKI